MVKKAKPTPNKLELAQKALKPFFDLHPKSELVADGDPNSVLLKRPWNDESLQLGFSASDSAIRKALNSVYLPERYSALYHRKKRRLEVIYTVFPPAGERADIRDRSFEFNHKGQFHTCHYGASSQELLLLAKHVQPTQGAGATNYRNLIQFNLYVGITEAGGIFPQELRDSYKDAKPLSFWVENVDWDEENIYDLMMHINFYMFYYDRETPLVLIHTPPEEARLPNPLTRFIKGKFPQKISCTEIDHDLLHFWLASVNGDAARRFLLSYQIIEYAAFYMVEDDIARSIRKLLASPDAISRSFEVAAEIVEAFGETKLSDPQKIEMVIKKFVSPDVVWDALKVSMDSFTKPTTFDGGFSSAVLAKENWEASDFAAVWPNQFANAIRNMRNALSHGREQRMVTVITPTATNMRKLQPWVPLVAATAREIMIYRTTS